MFDVKRHLIKVQGGRQYLPVSARLVWFRQEHPDWGIETRPIVMDIEKQYAIFEASVFNAEGKLMAKGTKMETVRGFPDFIEKAETGAIGRALAVCGFGTQFAPDLDEIDTGRAVRSGQSANGFSGSSQPSAETGKDPTCVPCGRALTNSQVSFSERKYGLALCPACQKDKKTAVAA